MTDRIKAVIFDCDGVLVDTEVRGRDLWIERLRALGAPFTPEEFSHRFNGLTDDAFYRALPAEAETLFGVRLSGDLRAEGARIGREVRASLAEIPGAAAAVRACPVPVAVASSSRRDSLAFKLQFIGLTDYFASQVTSGDDVRRGKPAPDIFLKAAAGLEIDPERCLVVEDSVNGVLAAQAAGMTAWGFVGGGHCLACFDDRLRAAGASAVLCAWPAFTMTLLVLQLQII